jgi:hypothetical protein
MLFPLPLLRRLLAASKIQCMASQRLRRRDRGTGTARAMPPPAWPLSCLMRRMGATLSMANWR